MKSINTIIARMRALSTKPAMYWRGSWIDYDTLFNHIDMWTRHLRDRGLGQGNTIGVFGDYSPATVSLIYALMLERAIVVPFTAAIKAEVPGLAKIAGVEHMFRFAQDDTWQEEAFPEAQRPELIEKFQECETPGVVVFSSGSTGQPKGILQDCERVMHKFVAARDGWRTVLFLMMDHFGGFNTLLGAFAYGGAGICVDQRQPESVCRAIEESAATLLPTTPTFINLLLASGSWRNFDLSSVRLITYGTEMMSEATLDRIKEAFPSARIKQTYGLSELGVLRSKTVEESSTWLKIGGKGFETKIIDGVLWIRSEANMVGYLNAPNPFDEDGWMSTGDKVEVKDDLIRFLGRESEIINVGGQKVFPIEVETVLMQADNILEATAYGVDHRLLGKMVEARVSLKLPEDPDGLRQRLRHHCMEKLAKFKVPGRFHIVDVDEQRGDRFKKIRNIKPEKQSQNT